MFLWGGALLKKAYFSFNKLLNTYILFFLLLIFLFLGLNGYWDNQEYICTFLVFPLIIILILKSKICNKIFNNQFFSFLGAVAFEMYIWHSPLLDIRKFFVRLFNYTYNINHLHMICFTIIVFLWSCLMYLIEKRLYSYLLKKTNFLNQ